MARLYSNENFPLPVVEELRRLGHDVVTIQERGRAGEGVPDDEVLQFATDEGRMVLTSNRRDFIRLHRARSDHAGIVVCTVDTDFNGQARRIHAELGNVANPRGLLLRVNRPSV